VQLRDHPAMTRKSGFSSWPPAWINNYQDDTISRLAGEIGTLERVLRSQVKNQLFIVIRHRGFLYTGSLHLDDLSFCYALSNVLNDNIARSLKEIGDIDLSYTL
jgi:hypothetical protein